MRIPARLAAAVVLLLLAQGCATSRPSPPSGPEVITGMASWYGQEFAGRATANGEVFDPMLLTAAHRTLPFGTVVEVRNTANGRSVRVRINDRGPFIAGRVIDLSYAAAQQIGLVESGVASVEVRILGKEAAPSPQIVATPTPAVEVDAPEIAFPIPGERAAPSPAPAPLPAEPLQQGFVVQLGSFQQRSNAHALERNVARVIPGAHVVQSGVMYRVRVGPYSTREEAIEMRERLEGAGFSGIVMAAGR